MNRSSHRHITRRSDCTQRIKIARTALLVRIHFSHQDVCMSSMRFMPVAYSAEDQARLRDSGTARALTGHPGRLLPSGLARRRARPGATRAVGLPGCGDPLFLVYRPAAVRQLHLGLGNVNPADPVSLANIHPRRYLVVVPVIHAPVLRAGNLRTLAEGPASRMPPARIPSETLDSSPQPPSTLSGIKKRRPEYSSTPARRGALTTVVRPGHRAGRFCPSSRRPCLQ